METPYRSDEEALAARLGELEARLREIRDRRTKLQALADDEAALDREIAEVRGKVRKARLPILQDVRVASPCTADWDRMVGDERVRFCGECAKSVYNLSEMTKPEAEAFVEAVRVGQAKGASTCIRFYQRADGTMLTADCPVGVKRRRRRRIVATVAVSAAVAASGFYALASRTMGKAMVGQMGDMAPPPEPTVQGLMAPTQGTAAPMPSVAPNPSGQPRRTPEPPLRDPFSPK